MLEPDDLCPLNQGQRDPKGNIAVIAAGTGLGEGGLCWAEGRYAAIASEGGHATFGPSSPLEVELWRFLNERYGHVSWERVVSGQGLAAIYDFLCERHPDRADASLAPESEQPDRADAIARAGLESHSALAVTALDLFALLYGRETGNLALKLMSSGEFLSAAALRPRSSPSCATAALWRALWTKAAWASRSRPFPSTSCSTTRPRCWVLPIGGRSFSLLAEQLPEPSGDLFRLAFLETHRPKNHHTLVHICRIGGNLRPTFL